MAFIQPLDIANLALLRLGQPRIGAFTDSSKGASEMAFVYDKLRQAELEANLWRFATKRTVLRAIGLDTVLWMPATWAASVSQAAGMVLAYAPTSGVYSGQTAYWQLRVAETTSASPDTDVLWDHYCGPLAIDLYNTGSAGDGTSNTTYSAGEVVLVPATYAGGTTYAVNDVVNSGGSWYVSLAGSNTGNTPASSATWWVLWTSRGRSTGSFGQTASGSAVPLTYPGTPSIYISLYSSNEDNPVSATGNWLSLGGTVKPLTVLYPIGAGPVTDPASSNAFYLPNGFLKRAPTDPKGGQMPWLGASYGVMPEDWSPEGNFLISATAGPLMLRFVADITDVTKMDALFCVALAERAAADTCETITSSDAKVQMAERSYRRAIANASRTNMIEIGAVSNYENRFITVRN